MAVAGIDSGLHSTKVVLVAEGQVRAEVVMPAGVETAGRMAEEGLSLALAQAGISPSDLGYTMVTGRGKSFIPTANETAPDFMCLAQGIYRISPSVHSVLDVGAEKSLAIRCSQGRVLHMVSNDKCAAGTGTYLQMVSLVLNVPLEQMGELSLHSTEAVEVNSTCAVFAESEIISLIHAGKRPQDILRGVYRGLALRLHPLLVQAGLEGEVALVGGVALDSGVRCALEAQLGYQLLVPEHPLTVSALGAATIAETRVGVRM